MQIQEEEEEERAQALEISLLCKFEAGPSGSKQDNQWALLNTLTGLEAQIKAAKSMAELQINSKINLKVKVSSLECQLENQEEKIQEMSLALSIKESLYKQELKKHKEVVTQNTKLQK